MKTSRKFRVMENMVCMIDPDNELKQSVSGLTRARTIRRVKYRPFGRSIWEVCDDINPEMGTCMIPEKYIFPVGLIVTRFPNDMPIFNDKDINNLKMLFNLLNSIPDYIIDSYAPKGTKLYKSEICNRLNAIALKIKQSMKMREI